MFYLLFINLIIIKSEIYLKINRNYEKNISTQSGQKIKKTRIQIKDED